MIKASGRAIAVICLGVGVASGAEASTLVNLHGGPLALDVRGLSPDARSLSSGASLDLNLPAVTMQLQASASVGGDQADNDLWRKQGAQLKANWSALYGTNFEVTGTDHLALIYRAPASIGDPGTATHLVHTESRTAALTASFSPVSQVQVKVGADGSSALTQDTSVKGPVNGSQTAVQSNTQEVFAHVDWQPVDWAAVQAGAAEQSSNIVWRSQTAHTSVFNALEPHLAMMLTPWSGTEWAASVEHSVSPYDTAAFSAYASVARSADNVNFEPDHAWTFQTRLKQNLGPATVTAAYTADRWGTATEFAEVRGGVQAPASTPLKGRDKVALTVSLPLGLFGMPNTSVSSGAAWQNSSVLDPVTEELRRASGETPRKFSLRLVRNLPARHLSLGLTGELDDTTTSYQLSEISTVPAGGTLGAFLAYKPGPFEVDLNVNGLCGGPPAATDFFYNGTRANPQMARTEVQPSPGPAFNLSLHRAL
ncbi:MAG: hypothetical protein KGL56_02785 [Alphaproteobacteria bacterium]|nr:hypothetical protein [Alphaproteobacteria bacterium]MDE2164444.1 hypothetical protein [Alphaproteobacteria bacterium]MDE2499093.1 hypothetical protein [Alphaproteobacteria bacterium]